MMWHPNSIVAIATARINGKDLSKSYLHMSDEFDSFDEVRDHIMKNITAFIEDNDLENNPLSDEVNSLVDHMEEFHAKWLKDPKLLKLMDHPEEVEFVDSDDDLLAVQIKFSGTSFHMHYKGAANKNSWDQIDFKIHWL